MDGGTGGDRPAPRGRVLARLAAIALAFLALATLPLAAADPGSRPLDALGPVVTSASVSPDPVVPDPVVVTARAMDAADFLAGAEFFIDTPGLDGFSFFRLRPVDNNWSALVEDLVWTGPYDTFTLGHSPGPHDLFVHAMDAVGNWGPYAIVPFYIGDPASIGPGVRSPVATPADAAIGATVTIEADAWDPFRGTIEAAEIFFDVPGPDGTGEAMAGSFDSPAVHVVWSRVLDLALGEHTAYVHAKARGLWGAPASIAITARAPAFTLRLAVDPSTATPGDVVTYGIDFENRGNANASNVSLDLILPPSLAYLDDTVADAGGWNVGGTSYAFANVPTVPRSFTVRGQVLGTSTDGLPLDAQATLDFTNDQTWDFPAVTASTSGSVVAPEIAISVSAPAEAYAGETTTLTVRIEHTGIRTIPVVDVALETSGSTILVSDTARLQGGVVRGLGLWRFANLVPGTHPFDITERVSATATDGLVVGRLVQASYVSRLGDPLSPTAAATFRVSRPTITASLAVDRSEVRQGDRVTFTLEYANVGTAAAQSVRITTTLPPSLAIVGGDAATFSSGDLRVWERTSVRSGTYRLAVVAEARSTGAVHVGFDLAYTSPNGADLGQVAVSADVALVEVPAPPTSLYVGASFAGLAAVLSGVAATERGKTALLFLFIPLYTRLQREHVLDHETRGMIRGYIVANPGDHYNSIKGALELPNGTLAYHLQVLEKEMVVRSVKDGKFRRFYPYEMRMPEGGEPTKIQRVILDLIRANPGITPRDAASLLGLTSSTVSYHLERLAELGRIEHRREGISKRLFVRGDLEP